MDSVHEVKCIDCQVLVRVSAPRELTKEELDELAVRMLCTPCVKKQLNAKK